MSKFHMFLPPYTFGSLARVSIDPNVLPLIDSEPWVQLV